MPELPEVEVLVRHLRPLLRRTVIQAVHVHRAKVISPTSVSRLRGALTGARFDRLTRRGKYLVFTWRHRRQPKSFKLLSHLGMTGRIYLQSVGTPLPRHAAVVLRLKDRQLVFEDTRYFGRFTLDIQPLLGLGPEPLSPKFTALRFAAALKGSTQPIKAKLLDQSVAAGIGNIYASEALFLARIHPLLPARQLKPLQIRGLVDAIRSVLRSAIQWGSTVPLDWEGASSRDGLFYYGSRGKTGRHERLRVYGRHGKPCFRCQCPIQRILVRQRGTFFCPHCQHTQLIRPTAADPRNECRARR
jgi:formamidopyrimidine-DNA glycosylase